MHAGKWTAALTDKGWGPAWTPPGRAGLTCAFAAGLPEGSVAAHCARSALSIPGGSW